MKHMKRFCLFTALLLLGLCSYAQTAFETRIAELGLSEIVTDWSDSAEINIPRPKCAYVNITGIDNMPMKVKKWLGHPVMFRYIH